MGFTLLINSVFWGGGKRRASDKRQSERDPMEVKWGTTDVNETPDPPDQTLFHSLRAFVIVLYSIHLAKVAVCSFAVCFRKCAKLCTYLYAKTAFVCKTVQLRLCSK